MMLFALGMRCTLRFGRTTTDTVGGARCRCGRAAVCALRFDAATTAAAGRRAAVLDAQGAGAGAGFTLTSLCLDGDCVCMQERVIDLLGKSTAVVAPRRYLPCKQRGKRGHTGHTTARLPVKQYYGKVMWLKENVVAVLYFYHYHSQKEQSNLCGLNRTITMNNMWYKAVIHCK